MIEDKNIETINDYRSYRQQEEDRLLADEFLSEFQSSKPTPTQPAVEEKKVEAPTEQLPKENIFKRIGKDIGRGVVGEGPRAVLSGVTKGINEIADLANDFNQFLGANFAKGVVSAIGDEEAKKRVFQITAEKKKEQFAPVPQPTFGVDGSENPKSVTGNVIEDIAQFLTGFGVAGKALSKSAKFAQAGKVTQLVTQGALGDVLAFDEQEERLSDALQGTPLEVITQHIQSNEDDSLAEGKIKQAIEGAGLGLIGEGLFKAAKAIRKNVKFKKGIEAELEGLTKAPEAGLETKQLSMLGKPESNDFIYNKLEVAKQETGELTAEQVTKLKPQTADDIQINFARINSPEDLKQAMQAYANETSLLPKVQDARRGVRSNEVTLKSAEDIDAFKTLLERREGQALNAEQITAARNFYYSTTEKLMELAKKAASPEATDIDQYAFRKMVATHHAVQKEVLGARAEAGRALQAWSIPAEGTSSEKLKGMEAILDSFGGTDTSKELAKALASLPNHKLTTDNINYITQKSAYARTRDAIIEAWTAGLLTNPVTHSRNLASNALTTMMGAVERYAQAAFPQSDVTIQEANAFVLGILQSQKEAIANAGRAFRTGETGFGQGKVELPRVRASSMEELNATGIFKPFGYAMDYYGRVVNTSFKALAAGDEYGKTVLYKAKLNALATREGIGKGLKGNDLIDYVAKATNAPSGILQQEARDFAKYGTFVKDLCKKDKGFQRILAQAPVARFIIPFYLTPVNIFKYTFERTPLALASEAVQKELKAGGTRQAAALAKIGMGSSMMLLGVDMSINGHITGSGPRDKKLRQHLLNTGWQPNSIKIGKNYYSYAGLEPISTLFSFSSTMAEILTNYEMYDIEAQDEMEKVMTASVIAISDASVNKTFLQGISNIMQALTDSDRFAQSYINKTLSSFVPSISAGVERAVSPEKEMVESLADAFKSRIVGFSDDLPKRRNIYGEVLKYRYPDEVILDQTTSAITSLFNPFYKSVEKDSPLDEFLLKEGLFVDMPSKNQYFEGTQINLKEYPQIYSRFLELRGQQVELLQYGNVNMKQALTDLISEDSIKSSEFFSEFKTQKDKQDLINQIIEDYNNEAKKILQEEYPIIDQLILEDINNKKNLFKDL